MLQWTEGIVPKIQLFYNNMKKGNQNLFCANHIDQGSKWHYHVLLQEKMKKKKSEKKFENEKKNLIKNILLIVE